MILRVIVENFLPFRTRVEFPLADQGLVLVRGDNRVSAALNDNGSGKTSILHAIAWCLYGEDLHGRKADAVANRFTTETCQVQMDMEDERGIWSVIRTRRPGKLWVEGDGTDAVPPDSNMDVVQEYIESRMGFGLRTFRNAVVFGQGAFDRFAQADQSEQMKMLDEIQGLDYSTPRQGATDWRKTLAAKMGEIERGINDDGAMLEETKNQIKTLTDIRNQFEVRQFERMKLNKAKATGVAGSIATLKSDIQEINTDVKILERARFEENVLIEKEAALSLTRQAEDEAGALQDEAGTNLRRHDEKLERLLKHSECPECLSVIEGAWSVVKDRFSLLRAPLAADQMQTAETYRKSLGASAAALDAVETQQTVVRKIVGGTADLSRMIMRLEERTTPRRLKTLTDDLVRLESEQAKAKAEWAEIKAEKWDGAEALARASEKVTLLTVRIAREQGRMDKAGIAVDLAEYCAEAFSDRGIRSLMVDNVADFVNERMVEHLNALTAGEATNAMSATQELKKGGTKERITFKPTWAWGGEGAGTGSGGQDRRVDLSTFASMQDLAETQSARPFPFKAYDEPFDALDSRGKEMACTWLREQAKKRTVLLITHSEELAGLANPDQTWTIVHDENGARLMVSK